MSFAIFGTGFWSRYQLAAWRELEGVRCVALYNRTRSKAEALACEFGVSSVYDDPETLLKQERLDFIDVITDVDTHSRFVHFAADCKIPVICQKPMAPSLKVCEEMARRCQEAGVPLLVHENWRWQCPLRQLKRILDEGHIGLPFRARIQYSCSFPVFENQPFLKDLDQFILADIGSHILDAARFLFGEAKSLYCQTHRVHPSIQGEDVATVMMRMDSGATVVCEMSYASRLEHERFPETYVLVEGEKGSVELGPDFWIRTTVGEETRARRFPPPRYAWADPAYALVHSSIVDCHRDLLAALQGRKRAETCGEDNLQTMKLVFHSYRSAETSTAITVD